MNAGVCAETEGAQTWALRDRLSRETFRRYRRPAPGEGRGWQLRGWQRHPGTPLNTRDAPQGIAPQR